MPGLFKYLVQELNVSTVHIKGHGRAEVILDFSVNAWCVFTSSCVLLSTGTVYSFNLECFKIYSTALLEGISATINLCIQALKLYIYYKIDIYLKDVILALSWGA